MKKHVGSKVQREGADTLFHGPPHAPAMLREWSLDEANARLASEGYPPIARLPADEAALASWKRIVDAQRELELSGEVSDATLLAISAFCHCLKCPTYPRGEKPVVYCLSGESRHDLTMMQCKCPTCAVYEVADLGPQQYFCSAGVAKRGVVRSGGVAEAARRFLQHEVEKGNPGKRLPERLMAPPGFVGRTQEEVEVPEKVPGTTSG